MGHRSGGRGQFDAATVGAHYRHTKPDMLGQVAETVETYLRTALGFVPHACPKPSSKAGGSGDVRQTGRLTCEGGRWSGGDLTPGLLHAIQRTRSTARAEGTSLFVLK